MDMRRRDNINLIIFEMKILKGIARRSYVACDLIKISFSDTTQSYCVLYQVLTSILA